MKQTRPAQRLAARRERLHEALRVYISVTPIKARRRAMTLAAKKARGR